MLTVDARNYILETQNEEKTAGQFHKKPVILMTGQHHSREFLTPVLPLFSILKLFHGLIHGDTPSTSMLLQNRYLVVPTVNVDGLAYIEDQYLSTGKIETKRTNMDIMSTECGATYGGVDLNRNYDFKFGTGDAAQYECEEGMGLNKYMETYPGVAAFSEPETQAIRDLLKNQVVDFVYNMHSAGKDFIFGYNGASDPEEYLKTEPDLFEVMAEIYEEGQFPDGEISGNSQQILGKAVGGEASDWISNALGIPAADVELGEWPQFKDWVPLNASVAFSIIEENLPWLEYTYMKLGNQIEIEAAGYSLTVLDDTNLTSIR